MQQSIRDLITPVTSPDSGPWFEVMLGKVFVQLLKF